MFHRRYERLSRVLRLLPPESPAPLADVGCDHAMLSLAAIVQGTSNYVVAIDKAKEPLITGYRRVTALIESGVLGKENCVPIPTVRNWRAQGIAAVEEDAIVRKASEAFFEMRLGNGASALRDEELIDAKTGARGTVVIAGVGVRSMLCEMLHGSVRAGAGHLVLQPTSSNLIHLFYLREALWNARWHVNKEDLFFSSGRFYVSISARARENATDPSFDGLSRVQTGKDVHPSDIPIEEKLLLGRLPQDCDDCLFREYIEKQIDVLKGAADKAEEMKQLGYTVKPILHRQQLWLPIIQERLLSKNGTAPD